MRSTRESVEGSRSRTSSQTLLRVRQRPAWLRCFLSESTVDEMCRGIFSSSRFVSLLACMTLEISAGTVYASGIYTSYLKGKFFSGPDGQSRLETIIFASNLGLWVPLAGFFYDSFIGGNRNSIILGVVLTSFGYGGVCAWASGLIDLAPWQAWVCFFCLGHAGGYFDTSAVVTVARNFPRQTGQAMGILKAFFGVSGAVITLIYSIFFFQDVNGFLGFLSIAPSVVASLACPFIYFIPDSSSIEENNRANRKLFFGQRVVLVLACVLTCSNVSLAFASSSNTSNRSEFEVVVSYITGAATLVLLLLMACSLGPFPRRGSSESPPADNDQRDVGSLGESDVVGVTVKVAMLDVRFWMIFLVIFLGLGPGVVIVNHIGQMVACLGGDERSSAVAVSSFSVAQCFGRVLMGIFPYMHMLDWPVGSWLAVNSCLMALACLLVALATIPTLCLGAFVAGFSFGGFMTLIPLDLVAFFGTRRFATLYNINSLAISAASLLFSTYLASELYDREALRHPAPLGGCGGSTCYQLTSLIMAGFSALGAIVSVVLCTISRVPYRADSGSCL